jgi:23S rRNA (pseudouridine1915-N3)-methyltransferase
MRLIVIAVGQKMPQWAQVAVDDYAKRFPPELKFEVRTVKVAHRASQADAHSAMLVERERIEALIPRGAHVVALDERGKAVTTKELAQQLQDWQLAANDVVLLIGGPDGLDDGLKASAQQQIRLSHLTLPHAMARVLLVEQLYRAWSVNANHPYHRE